MEVVKVKIPVGKNGLYQKFLANPWGKKGVGCASGCIKIVLDDNMMDQIRSFKASRNHLNQDIIPVDIIPGKTDPYLIVDKSGDIFWVGGVDPTELWTPERNTKGQYKEIKRKDGTIIYKLDEHLGETVPPNSNSELNAYVVSNSTVDEGKQLYPVVPPPKSSKSPFTYRPTKGGKSKKRRTRRLKKKSKKKQTKKRKKKRRTKKRYKRRKKKSVRKRGKKKN
jgi:hypothetical protein